MIKNPYLNALMAGGYIVLLVSVGGIIESMQVPEESIILPMIFISVLVMSVALMAILFFYQPVRLLLEGQKDEALKFFGKTFGTFVIFVAILAIIVLSI